MQIQIDERGLKHRWVARQLGISPYRLSRLVTGALEPTDAEVVKLAEVLRVSPDEVREGARQSAIQRHTARLQALGVDVPLEAANA